MCLKGAPSLNRPVRHPRRSVSMIMFVLLVIGIGTMMLSNSGKKHKEPAVQPRTSHTGDQLDLRMQHEGRTHQVRFYRADVTHAWNLVARPRFNDEQLNYRYSTYLPIHTDRKTGESHLFPSQIILLSDFPDIRTAKVHADCSNLCALSSMYKISCVTWLNSTAKVAMDDSLRSTRRKHLLFN